MGLFVGVGDLIFWGIVCLVFVVLGVGFVIDGSIIGLILFFVLFNVICLGFCYWGVFYGYIKGIDVVFDMFGGLF